MTLFLNALPAIVGLLAGFGVLSYLRAHPERKDSNMIFIFLAALAGTLFGAVARYVHGLTSTIFGDGCVVLAAFLIVLLVQESRSGNKKKTVKPLPVRTLPRR